MLKGKGGRLLNKKILAIISFLIIFMISCTYAADFKINDGFTAENEYYSVNDENGMYMCTWEYDDELTQESYLQNSSNYIIVQGDNNTYNTTEDWSNQLEDIISYMTTSNITFDHGVLEVVEFDGEKYIIYAYMEAGPEEDWKTCYDELMKFNENNKIEPLAEVI